MKNVSLLLKGSGGDVDRIHEPEVLQHSSLVFDGAGNARTRSPYGFFTTFPLLPAAAVAAGSEKILITAGTGIEVASRSAKGGVNMASAAADNDQAMLIGIATTDSVLPIAAKSKVRFATRVSITTITSVIFAAGFDQTFTNLLGETAAGEGAQFLFDPADELQLVTEQAAAGIVAANFICATKVAGVDSYRNTGVKVVAGVDYELAIEVGGDLISRYYINGVLVGTAATAHVAASVGVALGVQNGSAATRDFDCRQASFERVIG